MWVPREDQFLLLLAMVFGGIFWLLLFRDDLTTAVVAHGVYVWTLVFFARMWRGDFNGK